MLLKSFGLWCGCFLVVTAQNNDFRIGDSLNAFAINLLSATTEQAGDEVNVALSPFTVWTLLSIISEGAQGDTSRQIRSVLQLSLEKSQLWKEYQNLTINLKQKNSDQVTLDYSSAIFVNSQFAVKPEFKDVAQRVYNVTVTPTNFSKTNEATQLINDYVAKATKNRIPMLIREDDVTKAQIFLSSVLYFKGKWQIPFNKTATKREPFFDSKSKRLGEVTMMFRSGTFPYSRIKHLRAYAVELPYGNDVSMVVMLPFAGDTLTTLLNTLSKTPFRQILQLLFDAELMYMDEETQVFLPKFKIASDLSLLKVLHLMGIRDLFDSQKAELLGVVDQYLYVSQILQKAEIEVDEDGTVASSATSAGFSYKSPPPRFYANNPFLYFIVDKVTKSIIFSGKVTNPNGL